VFKKFGELLSQKSLLAITGSSVFLLMTMILMSSMYNYLFPNYYNYSKAIAIINFINPIVIFLIVSPIASKIGKSLGKKGIINWWFTYRSGRLFLDLFCETTKCLCLYRNGNNSLCRFIYIQCLSVGNDN